MPEEAEIDRVAFPRLHAYVRALPSGLDSHPTCLSKASIYRKMLEQHAVDLSRGALPSAVVDLIEHPQPMGAWVPTTLGNAVELAVADTCGSDQAFLDAALRMNRLLLVSPMYRAMFLMLSPGMVLKTSAGHTSLVERGRGKLQEPESQPALGGRPRPPS